MAEQNRPASPQQAPDPATSYGRERPEKESGQGRLDNDTATPINRPHNPDQAVKNKQNPTRQVNAQDQTSPNQPDHSMFDEDLTDPDLAPTDIHDPSKQRHPRRQGKGGTP